MGARVTKGSLPNEIYKRDVEEEEEEEEQEEKK